MNTQTNSHPYTAPKPEALVSSVDLEEFKSGLTNYKAGRWHEDRWKTFRLRFGIYEQRQKGQHMVRIKVPGGRLSAEQAHTIAKANANHAGGSVHITTRQAIQLYFVDLDKLYDLLAELNLGGVTTRESSGGTFRNTTACALSANCEAANTDAVKVAENLSRAWLRNPLVQHMPRKVKTAVSGCELDCGLTPIDDLGFIATNKNGNSGFRVVLGGGLGTHPRTAVNIFDFVSEHDLPAVQEAVARIHHRYSNRENKNKSRLKFLVDKFGAEELTKLIKNEFEKIKPLPRRPWENLTWLNRTKTEAPKHLLGSVNHQGGSISVGTDVPLGILSSEQLDEITYLAKISGGNELILTRNQNIIATGLSKDTADAFIKGANHIGLDASGREHPLDDLVACFGSSTCAIGITDANALASQILDVQAGFQDMEHLRIRISGCHNSCGHHHIGDIGFHGVAKKINGKPAPHYQLHLGGSANQHAIAGPYIPARQVAEVLRLLLGTYGERREKSIDVRTWAEELGKDGIATTIQPALEASEREKSDLLFDVHDDAPFLPPETSTGECAAGTAVAEHLSDLALVARENVSRALSIGNNADAVAYAELAILLPARRLLVIAGENISKNKGNDKDEILSAIKNIWARDRTLLDGLQSALAAHLDFKNSGEANKIDAEIAKWQTLADQQIEIILQDVPGYITAGAAE